MGTQNESSFPVKDRSSANTIKFVISQAICESGLIYKELLENMIFNMIRFFLPE